MSKRRKKDNRYKVRNRENRVTEPFAKGELLTREFYTVTREDVEAVRNDYDRMEHPNDYATFRNLMWFRDEKMLRGYMSKYQPKLKEWLEEFCLKVFDVPKNENESLMLKLTVLHVRNDWGPNGKNREVELTLDEVKLRLQRDYNYDGEVCDDSALLSLMDRVFKNSNKSEN
jgi:hypothetical protein